ncbi:hypothetical protein Golax_009039 [Gossypium laxum]|uniref:Zinc knuckle CX2CX4HX4C domain-containing protein n=1 Tax=Gossypium laxum TaxID=34288 RepID=A0A7J9ABR9_9ROSI|nr:hypothetical protein [Gossypium laxum]
MAEDINKLLERLNFLEEESTRVVSSNMGCNNSQGFEAWAVGKIKLEEKVNRDAMYRVFKSLWFTKEEVNFIALKDVILVKFGNMEDRKRILNLSPCLFDQCLFAMLPYVKDQDTDAYAFNLTPFWLRIFNIPLEYMDRQVAMDVGKAIEELVAIDWRDRDGGWTEYIRLKVMIDVSKPLRRVVHLVSSDGAEIVCAIKYERLPTFCYICGLISHSTQKCDRKKEQSKSNDTSFQYGNWLRAQIGVPNQNRVYWRNGIEVITDKKNMDSDPNGEKQGNEEVNESTGPKGKEKKSKTMRKNRNHVLLQWKNVLQR